MLNRINYIVNKLQLNGINLDKKQIDYLHKNIIKLDNKTLLMQLNNTIKKDNKIILKSKHFKRYLLSCKHNKNKTVFIVNKLFKKFISELDYLSLYSCTYNYTQILHYDNYYFTLNSNKIYSNVSSLKRLL